MTIRPLSAPPPPPRPAKPATPPATAPTAPRDLPPELRLAPPEPPEPPTSTLRKVGLHVALGLSVLGVAGPLVHQGVQAAQAAKAAEALR